MNFWYVEQWNNNFFWKLKRNCCKNVFDAVFKSLWCKIHKIFWLALKGGASFSFILKWNFPQEKKLLKNLPNFDKNFTFTCVRIIILIFFIKKNTQKMCLIPLKTWHEPTEDRRPKPSLSRSTHGLLRSPLPYWIIDLTGLEQSDMQRKKTEILPY